MDRRDFIKLTAITGTSATLASCGNPEHQLIRFVPDEDIVPGVAEWKPSICPMCAGGCGMNVRVMDADVETTRNGQAGVVAMPVAKKLEGNAKDPISHGGLCARGQASIQVTYHPDRLTHPMKRTGTRGSGAFKEVGWDEAIAELSAQLDALAAAKSQQSLAFLARPHGGRRTALAAEFLKAFGAAAPLTYEIFSNDVLRRANGISFGHEQLPTIDLARSRFAISFGADFLGSWNSPVAQSAAYGEMRQGRPGLRGAFVQVESRMSLTGANADEWVPVKPGTEGVLALGIAHVILAGKRPADAGRAGAAIDGWSAGLPDYTPARVEQITGVAAKKVERLAHTLVELQPSVAFIGGPPLAHTNGMFHALAVNALNALLGGVGQPGGVFFTPGNPKSEIRILKSQDLASAKVLLLDGLNPVFGAPKAWKVREALAAIPFIASFGSFLDDTSILADLILPDHSFLESWVDSAPESGSIEAVTTSAGPVMKPLYSTRATADVLIEVAGKLKTPVSLPWKTAEEVSKSVGSQQSQSVVSVAVSIRNPQSAIRNEVRRAGLRRRCGDVSISPAAVRVAAVRRRIERASPLAAGNARPAHLGDVEQLGGDQSADGRASSTRAGRSGGPHLVPGHGARTGHDLPGHRARYRGDAGRAGTRSVHAVCERAGSEPDRDPRRRDRDRHRRAGLGRDPRQDCARRRRRSPPDHVRG